MKKLSNYIIILGSLMICVHAIGTQPVKFQSDLKQTDLRVDALRALILGGKNAPRKMRLRFSRLELDFAVFYDLVGQEILYKYREDRWDKRAEKKIDDLIPGQAYEVQGSWIGIYAEDKIWPDSAQNFRERLSNRDNRLVFQYDFVKPLRLEQILY